MFVALHRLLSATFHIHHANIMIFYVRCQDSCDDAHKILKITILILYRKRAWSNSIQMSTRYGKPFSTIIPYSRHRLYTSPAHLYCCCIHIVRITIKSFPRVWQYRLMYSATWLVTSRVILAYCVLFLAVPETPEWDVNSFSITHNDVCKTRREHIIQCASLRIMLVPFFHCSDNGCVKILFFRNNYK